MTTLSIGDPDLEVFQDQSAPWIDHAVADLERLAGENGTIVPDPLVRELAGEIARDVPGAHVVVNRLLVEGIDVAEQTT